MDTTQIVILVAALVVLGLYLMKRKNRLDKD